MQTFQYNKTTIAYDVFGAGEPLVLLHGFCEDSTIWDKVIKSIDAQIIRIDLPGFGQSELLENLTIPMMADIVAAVLDHLKIKTCIMIGHSMGGYVSLAFAEKYADRLIGLGLFHSHPYEDPKDKKAARDKSIDFIQRNGHIHFVKQLIPQLFLYGSRKSNTFEIESLTHKASLLSPETIIASLQAMRDRADHSALLANLTCPVLMIIGLEDAVIPATVNLEQTALPTIGSIHLLAAAAHICMLEMPALSQKIINDFLVFCMTTPVEQI